MSVTVVSVLYHVQLPAGNGYVRYAMWSIRLVLTRTLIVRVKSKVMILDICNRPTTIAILASYWSWQVSCRFIQQSVDNALNYLLILGLLLLITRSSLCSSDMFQLSLHPVVKEYLRHGLMMNVGSRNVMSQAWASFQTNSSWHWSCYLVGCTSFNAQTEWH